jgi:hypothetical protein
MAFPDASGEQAKKRPRSLDRDTWIEAMRRIQEDDIDSKRSRDMLSKIERSD